MWIPSYARLTFQPRRRYQRHRGARAVLIRRIELTDTFGVFLRVDMICVGPTWLAAAGEVCTSSRKPKKDVPAAIAATHCRQYAVGISSGGSTLTPFSESASMLACTHPDYQCASNRKGKQAEGTSDTRFICSALRGSARPCSHKTAAFVKRLMGSVTCSVRASVAGAGSSSSFASPSSPASTFSTTCSCRVSASPSVAADVVASSLPLVGLEASPPFSAAFVGFLRPSSIHRRSSLLSTRKVGS